MPARPITQCLRVSLWRAEKAETALHVRSVSRRRALIDVTSKTQLTSDSTMFGRPALNPQVCMDVKDQQREGESLS